MSVYYCRKCAIEIGEITEEIQIPENLIGTEHKLEKFTQYSRNQI